MPPGPATSHQASSQPMLPLYRSRYFHNGMPGYAASGWLSHLPPHLSRSPVPVPPLQARQPRQAMRYSTYPDPHEPIVPLRTEFSGAPNVHDGNRSTVSQGLEQPRPYSVPPRATQYTPAQMVHTAHEIRRPTSVAHTSAHTLSVPRHPDSNLPPVRREEKLGPSPPERGAQGDTGVEDNSVTPMGTFPSPISTKRKVGMANLEEHLQTEKKVASVTMEKADQRSTKKTRLSRKTAKGGKTTASQSTLPDNASNNHQGSKMRLVSSHPQCSLSQGSQPSQNSRHHSQNHTTSGSLGPIAGVVGESAERISLSPTITIMSCDQAETDKNTQTGTTSVEPGSIPERSYSPFNDQFPPGDDSQNLECESSQQPLLASATVGNKELHSYVPTSAAPKRSVSQATTVYTTSTEAGGASENGNVPRVREPTNAMSLIDETMVLERPISDIVNIRLREGNTDLLDTCLGEILIKMAVKDDELYEAVIKILRS
ncbi:hypothetical protein F4802DRAFT_549633 [Xylaria palmicola]|nr:hypothetical protein F4802DRAFT_549633 [Xylaria palmicola]